MEEKIYQTEEIEDWDFVKNSDIDVMEESKNSNKEAFWKCSKCETEYKKPINEFKHERTCPCSGEPPDDISYNESKFVFLYFLKSLPVNLVSIFLISLIGPVITLQLESFSINLLYTFIFSSLLLLLCYLFLINVKRYIFNKSNKLIKRKVDLYNLFMQNIQNPVNFEGQYYNNIFKLLKSFLNENNKEKYTDEEDLKYLFHTKNASYFKKYGFINNSHYTDFKNYLNIYKKNVEYKKLYSSIE